MTKMPFLPAPWLFSSVSSVGLGRFIFDCLCLVSLTLLPSEDFFSGSLSQAYFWFTSSSNSPSSSAAICHSFFQLFLFSLYMIIVLTDGVDVTLFKSLPSNPTALNSFFCALIPNKNTTPSPLFWLVD